MRGSVPLSAGVCAARSMARVFLHLETAGVTPSSMRPRRDQGAAPWPPAHHMGAAAARPIGKGRGLFFVENKAFLT